VVKLIPIILIGTAAILLNYIIIYENKSGFDVFLYGLSCYLLGYFQNQKPSLSPKKGSIF